MNAAARSFYGSVWKQSHMSRRPLKKRYPDMDLESRIRWLTSTGSTGTAASRRLGPRWTSVVSHLAGALVQLAAELTAGSRGGWCFLPEPPPAEARRHPVTATLCVHRWTRLKCLRTTTGSEARCHWREWVNRAARPTASLRKYTLVMSSLCLRGKTNSLAVRSQVTV